VEIFRWAWAVLLFLLALEEFFMADILSGIKLGAGPMKFALPALLICATWVSFSLVSKILKSRIPLKVVAFFLHVALIVSGIYLLKAGAAHFGKKITIASLQRPVGNCNPHLGFLMRTRLGERVVRKIASYGNPFLQYAYYAGEDYCRALKIAEVFQSPLPEICQEFPNSTDPLECFKEVLSATSPHSKIGALTHSRTAAKILGLSGTTESLGLAADAVASMKLAGFVLHLNKLREQTGSPEDILEKISQADKDKFLAFTQKYLSKGTRLLEKQVQQSGLGN
jgi:hypothetical protein